MGLSFWYNQEVVDFRKYDAIVFDCDGTLVDTMPLHYIAWTQVLKPYGMAYSEERFFQMGGISTEKTAAILAAEAGVIIDPQKVARDKNEVFLRELHRIQPIQKAVDFAQQAFPYRPLAIATGATRHCAELELRQVGILHLFSAMAAAEDVVHHKPSPDVYVEAARRLGVDPKRCLAFDDTPIGLQAARAAGMVALDIHHLTQG